MAGWYIEPERYTGGVQLTSYGYEAELNIHLDSGDTVMMRAFHEDNPLRACELVRDAVVELSIPGTGVELAFYIDEPGWKPHEDYYTLYV